MTEECTGNTIATSTTTPLNWWYLHQANSLSSWSNDAKQHVWNNNQMNPNSNSSSCEEDISVSSTSFTNASNHSNSTLTVDSSRRLVAPNSSNDFMGGDDQHASDNQLWSHVLSGVGSNGELHNNQEIGENLMDALSSKSMFDEPACDYLKKLDTTSWEYSGGSSSTTTPPPFNNNSFEKHLNGYSEALIENNERLTKLSNLVSTWSIAPPDPAEVTTTSHFLDSQTNNMSLNNSSMDHHYSTQPAHPNCHHFKQPLFGDNSTSTKNSGFNDDDQDMKVKQEYHHHQHHHASDQTLFGKPFNIANGYLDGFNSSSLNSVGESGKYYQGLPVPNNLSSCTKNFSDVISFNSRFGRLAIGGTHGQRPSMKYSNLSESKKHGLPTSSLMKTSNGRGEGTTRETKKKRSEESTQAMLKKAKQDTSTSSSSSSKVLAPKVKLADKITALQQIVSPFGKTDTASVLFEAIGYIKFLQEQVQLLSNPYLKANSHKDQRGISLDRKDDHNKEDGKQVELRSRGLCLVPTSCTPLVYRENSGPDYWTPAYRGCLYR